MHHFDLSMERMMRAMALTLDVTRYYLAGAYIEPIKGGGAWIVATNGHAMLIQRDTEAIAPKKAIIKISAPAEEPEEDEFGNRSLKSWDWGSSRIKIPAGEVDTVHACPVAQSQDLVFTHAISEFIEAPDRFPDWRAGLNVKRQTPATGTPDKRYTALQSTHMKLLTDWSLGFEIHSADPAVSRKITYVGDENSLGILMPMPRDKSDHLSAILAHIQ